MKPTVGRIVHYVLPYVFKKTPNVVRPAIIVRVWPGDEGVVQLQVFTDGSNDGAECAAGVLWQTSIKYDEAGEPGTWHWPPRDGD